MEHSSLITDHCHAAARRAATTFLSFLIHRLSKLSTSAALGMSRESHCCTRASDRRKNGRSLQITQICGEYMSCTSADEPQDYMQMSLQACKQAECETISACKYLHYSRAGGSKLTAGPAAGACWGTHPHSASHCSQMPETETCALISATSKHPAHVCTVLPQNLSQLWAQKHRDCSTALKRVQTHTDFHPVTPNPWGSERGRVCSEQPGQHQGLLQGQAQLLLCSALTQGFLSSCLETELPAFFQMQLAELLKVKESD